MDVDKKMLDDPESIAKDLNTDVATAEELIQVCRYELYLCSLQTGDLLSCYLKLCMVMLLRLFNHSIHRTGFSWSYEFCTLYSIRHVRMQMP